MSKACGGLIDWVNDVPMIPDSVHPLPDLLRMSAEDVLTSFKNSQQEDFSRVVAGLAQPGNSLSVVFKELAAHAESDNPFHGNPVFHPKALSDLFNELHEHVMGHPVWRHPFFVRIFDGGADAAQLRRFATSYFNQIKNTRQCVALALGRFNGLMFSPYGVLNERLSEITQISLAQLIGDEYGIGAHGLDEYPDLGSLFRSHTHIVMYRRFLDALGIAFPDQDEPMLWGVADNVLIQRLVAGDSAFSPLEALASVGLGMEWGVPEFFSLLLGGMIKIDQRDQLGLTPQDLDVFIAHVRYDVLHAVSVMLTTSLHMRGPDDSAIVKNACNTLMAGRWGMMSDVYEHVFGQACPTLAEMGLDRRYHVLDRRIEAALIAARRSACPKKVVRGDEYRARTDMGNLLFA